MSKCKFSGQRRRKHSRCWVRLHRGCGPAIKTGVQRVPGRGADVGKAAMSEAHETQGVGDLRHYMPAVGKKYTLELCRVDLSPVAVQTLPP